MMNRHQVLNQEQDKREKHLKIGKSLEKQEHYNKVKDKALEVIRVPVLFYGLTEE